jgi:uncharacterized membrane protein
VLLVEETQSFLIVSVIGLTDGLPKEGLRIQDVLVRLAILHLIQNKVKNPYFLLFIFLIAYSIFLDNFEA